MNAKRLFIIIIFLVGFFVAGCGPSGEQEAERILSGAAETTVANITVVPADTPVATLDVNLIVKQTFVALTQQAAGQKPASTPQTPSATHAQPAPTSAYTQPASTLALSPTLVTGGISGTLMYPSSGIPSLRIVAFQVGTSNYYYMDTMLGQGTYQFDGLPPASYHVVAYVLAGGGIAGGYSQMVPCGLQYGCDDHTLIDVVVTSGHITAGVDPNDYYAPQGTFPPDPVP